MLANGNYVVHFPAWWNGNVQQAGAVTFCSGSTPTTGLVSASNSLVGTTALENLGKVSTFALTNGNYVVPHPEWNGNRGSVTFGSGLTGVTGTVSSANSLVGTRPNEYVGSGVQTLANGNYVVLAVYTTYSLPGSVTWGNGGVGSTGEVSELNSLVGTSGEDHVGIPDFTGFKSFADGSYAIYSPNADNGNVLDAGAVTLGNGSIPVTGPVTQANSVRGNGSITSGLGWVYDYSAATQTLIVIRRSERIISLFRSGDVPITGRITRSNGAGVPGVSILITGSRDGWTTTDVGGNYRIAAPAQGSYSITPRQSGKIFDPVTQVFNSLMVPQVANFIASTASVIVSGRVMQTNGRGVRNALVTLTDSAGVTRTFTSGPSGNYVFYSIPGGQNYTISASARRFQPTSQALFLNDDVMGLNLVVQNHGSSVK